MSRPKRHRLFFALVPDDRIRRKLATLQKRIDGEGRAVPRQNFHVTLAFLGMQEAAVIPDVLDIAAALEFEPCKVRIDRFGCFRRAGVVWAGISAVPPALRDFQHRLVGALLDGGIGYDRKPWKFHLTLYRKMRMLPETMPPEDIEWELDGFSLIESVSVNRGVEYHAVGSW